MKNKMIWSGLFCIVMGVLLMCKVLGVFDGARPEYNGSRMLEETRFTLDFTEMNGTQFHTMTLEKGDELHCAWNIESGTVDLLFTAENGEKLYQGNKVDQADFQLVIPETGSYTFTVTGSEAKGFIDIQKIDE